MNGADITQIIGLAMALVLATWALQSRRMDARRIALMAAVWIAIIVTLTFVITVLTHAG